MFSCTFMKCSPCQCFKFRKVIHNITMFVLWFRRHTKQLLDIAVSYPEGKDLYPTTPESSGVREWITAIGIAICD